MDQRQLPEDFKDFINLLNSNDVCYLLVGGWAVGIYGNPRATKDIDFLISNDERNLKKLQKALREFGTPEIDMEYFKEKGYVTLTGSRLNIGHFRCLLSNVETRPLEFFSSGIGEIAAVAV